MAKSKIFITRHVSGVHEKDLAAPDIKFWCFMFTHAVKQP